LNAALSNWQTTPTVQPTELEAQKARFAEALLRMPDNAFGAAITVFGSDTMRALEASQKWPIDLYVLQVQADLLADKGEDEYLPSKAELARRIWSVGTGATDNKDKLAAFKLYAEVRSFIVKAEIVNNNTVNNNRVMVLKRLRIERDWEKAASRQQSKLIEHSRD
jgi:hypothetical protein